MALRSASLVLRAVLDHLRHAAEGRRMRVAAGLQEGCDVLLAPAAQAVAHVAAQVLGQPALDHAAREKGRPFSGIGGLFLQGEAAWRMASAAMAQPFHQILAAQQRLRVACAAPWKARPARRPRRPARTSSATCPAASASTAARRCRCPVGLLDRRHAMHEIRIKRLDVVRLDVRIRGIGHGRVQRMAVPGDAATQRAVEVFVAVVADARVLVGRDVGGIDDAQRRIDAQAAGVGLAALAVWQAMQSPARDKYSPCLMSRAWTPCGAASSAASADAAASVQIAAASARRSATDAAMACFFIVRSSQAWTSGPGCFRYCSRMACADQYASAPPGRWGCSPCSAGTHRRPSRTGSARPSSAGIC